MFMKVYFQAIMAHSNHISQNLDDFISLEWMKLIIHMTYIL